MYIYLLTQNEVGGYDTFDSMVVTAKDEESARLIHPKASWEHHREAKTPMDKLWSNSDVWAMHPSKVMVTLLGTARSGATEGIECASFNAG